MKRSTKLFHCTEAVSLDKNSATNSENIIQVMGNPK